MRNAVDYCHYVQMYRNRRRRTWAELSFSGPLRGPLTLHHRQIFDQTFLVAPIFWFQTGQTDRRTDGRTERQTDRRNKYVLGLPCFKKLINQIEDVHRRFSPRTRKFLSVTKHKKYEEFSLADRIIRQPLSF